MGRFGSVHAFGFNFAESALIRMKSGALLVHCWGLALADFGRDSNSLRGRHFFWGGEVNNAQFHVGRLATSGRHKYAMIADHPKLTAK